MTDKKTEALKLALKKAFDLGKRYWRQANSDFTSQWRKADVTLASFNQLVEDTIREALAEQPAQQQEPVAWLSRDDARLALWDAINKREFGNPTDDKLILDHLRKNGLWIGKYTSPPLKQPEHEPGLWVVQYKDRHEFVWGAKPVFRGDRVLGLKPLYTAPPKRELVGLSDDDKRQVLQGLPDFASYDEIMVATEAKLKEKNT